MTVTLTVDLRAADDQFLPRGDVSRLIELWQAFEPNLVNRTVSAGQKLDLEPVKDDGASLGRVTFTVEHPASAVIGPTTEFQIVSVIERPRVAPVYQCRTCQQEHRTAYGPFVCRKCPPDAARVCDEHVQLLPGSLEGTCPEHKPRCDCGQPATAYCVGPHCHSDKAWCDSHLQRRGENAYCAACYAEKFPACALPGCHAVGSLKCQHLDQSGKPCGRRVCARHATTWQVFGPERQGLVRCPTHAAVVSQSPAEMVYQILGNANPKDSRSVPRIAGFRYILAKPGRINPTESDALRFVLDAGRSSVALGDRIRAVVDANRNRWEQEINQGAEAVADAVRRLTAWMSARGYATAVPTVAGIKWMRARGDKPDTLLVRVDRRYFNRAARDAAERELGFSIVLPKEDNR